MNMKNDFRSYRGASIDLNHYLVIVKCKIKIEIKQEEKQENKKWNIAQYKNDDFQMAYREAKKKV